MPSFSDHSVGVGLLALALAIAPLTANADVVISGDPTQNMNCSAGMCVPTAMDAVLNVSDLKGMLGSGDVTVATAGSGVDANNIDVETALSWSIATALSLKATLQLHIDKEISCGMGNLALFSQIAVPFNSLVLGRHGRVTFQSTSSLFAINETAYTLVDSVAGLSKAIASNPSGSYALSDNYDASKDGTYSASPIQTAFEGTFEGLGNTISHLTINHVSGGRTRVGLFSLVLMGTVDHVRLAGVAISGEKGSSDIIGALAGGSDTESFFQNSASGTIHLKGIGGVAGGLIGGPTQSYVDTSFADVAIDARHVKGRAETGGLVGENGSQITNSFALGSVTVGKRGRAGGLVGFNLGLAQNSYSLGAVSGGINSKIGGLLGYNKDSAVEAAYSTGAVSGEVPSSVGGFAGKNGRRLKNCYWDTTTSGTTQAVGKGHANRIIGLTTEQLQSGLPRGFDPNIWGQNSNINNGLPYLLANPPTS